MFKKYCDECGKSYRPTGKQQKFCKECYKVKWDESVKKRKLNYGKKK